MMFHVYSNNGVSWFDNNNVRFFGGLNPSNWGDGNPVVWQMHQSIPVIARLFTRRGVGTPLGATVCSETWYLYSSTDTKYAPPRTARAPPSAGHPHGVPAPQTPHARASVDGGGAGCQSRRRGDLLRCGG